MSLPSDRWNGLLIDNSIAQTNPLGFTGCNVYYATRIQPLGVSYSFDGGYTQRACVYANVGIDVTYYKSVTITTQVTGYGANFGYSTSINTGGINTILATSSKTATYDLSNKTGIVYFGWEKHASTAISGSGKVTYMKFNFDFDVSGDVNPQNAGTITGTGFGGYGKNENASFTAIANDGYDFLNWTENGSVISSSNPYTFSVNANRNLVANFRLKYTITLVYDSTLGSASYEWGQGNNVILTASPNANAQFKGWYIGATKISSNLTTTYEVSGDTTFEARFTPKYTISLDYDSSLGSASFTRDSNEQNLIYLSVNSTITQFNGWYINNTLISYNEQAQYQISEDSVIQARFEPIWNINDSVVGNGSIQYTRQASNRNLVEFSVIPSANWHFVKYVVGDDEYTTTPLQLNLANDISITAYFEENEKYHITASANINNAYVYISHNDDYGGYSATLFARPFPNYIFKKWSDGETDNPRTIVVNQDTTLIAEYSHEIETNGIYQYRCFVKDQMNMTQPPKAFMVVDTFTIREDYLTNATSRISVLKITDNINNGDVIVVYNPKGEVIYNGVITSISDNEITTSQMQSFYKGLWIYNVSPQTTLEQELAYLLGQYAQGKVYRSTYTDSLVAQRLGGITIQSTNATQVHLPTDLDKDGNEQMTQYDMEQFIYKMYQDYGIVFEFEINFEGTNYVRIKVPTYTSLKVGNNHYAIQNLSPITTIEETNRLIIYSKDKAYRTTYVATKQGIVEQPSATTNRFDITNTKVVFSDDDVQDLVASNLPNTMFNHKITFTLFIKNALYQYKDFILGMPLDIWYGSDYFSSVLTGRTLEKASNQNVASVDYVCGLVRTALTKKLSLGII